MEAKFAFAQSLILSAGAFLCDQMSKERTITVKSERTDLVTDLDKTVQDFLIEAISSRYPDDRFFAEEMAGQSDLNKGNVWVIDPIDGTVNFITQRTDFAIMIAYLEEGIGQFGLVYDVMAKKLYAGGGQFLVTCNGQEVHSSRSSLLQDSLVAVNTGLYVQNEEGLKDYFGQALGIRNYGCAGLSMMKVLTGQLFAYASHLYPWDFLAGQIMGETLGLQLMRLDGRPLEEENRQKVIFLPQTAVADFLSRK